MLRAAGFLLGLTIVALAIGLWRVPPGDGKLGADLTFSSVPNDRLAVSPSGPFVQWRGITPSGRNRAVTGRVAVRNRTRAPMRVQLRAPADRPGLDALMRVEATAGRTLLVRGTLADLRRWTRRSFPLAPHEERNVRVRAWLPETVGGRYRGLFVTLTFEFRPARDA